MKVRISRPTYHLDNWDYHGDVKQFYDMLLETLTEMGIEYDEMGATLGHLGKKVIRAKDTLCLSWHLHGNLPDVWHLKTAYLPDYFYFDKHGYSAWSDLAREYNHDVDMDDIREEIQTLCDEYITNNRSRALQPEEALIPEGPYVLVLLQRNNDTVMNFAHMDSQTLLNEVTELYKDTVYTVCAKSHPFKDVLKTHGAPDIKMDSSVFEATGSLHKIIAGAAAVYTVNSGSGFEALLHGKRVFTSGDCDYHWVTTPVKNKQDLRNTMHLVEEPVDTDEILKFLHYALTKYFVHVNDKQRIKERIELALSNYSTSL